MPPTMLCTHLLYLADAAETVMSFGEEDTGWWSQHVSESRGAVCVIMSSFGAAGSAACSSNS